MVAAGTVVAVALAGACSSGGGEQRVSTDVHATTSVAAPSSTQAKPRTHRTQLAGTTTASPPSSEPANVASEGSTPGSVTVVVGGDASPTVVTSPPVTAVAPPPTLPPPPPTTVPGPKPYDPNGPIDLSGTPGVTPAEQARAEQLIRDTLRDTKKYESPSAAYADGYRSIGDASTGDEHYVKWAYANDGHILDSKRPESLVYERKNGTQFLAAAMYSLPPGSTFADVPDVGGPLTQWHVHNDLCLADNPADPLQKVVSSLTTVNGQCPPGSSKLGAAPMLHVWVIPNKCGPFAALEGVGAGQIPPGQTRLCDTAHGG
jgi:hypothetical protein